jgi:class 3 adenylate cyclase
MDVAEWLKVLGLGQYASAFAENDIDFTILNELTDSDLKELGVSSLGHRKRLLEAIAVREDPRRRVSATPEPFVRDAAPLSPVVGEAKGERRHVTVLFSDLVDSTGIAAGLDAEEWRDLVGAYLDASSAAVAEMGGKVSKKLGDGLMALFGYPVAQENDAERAVRAALAIQRSLAELNRKNADAGKPALTARIAIETGPVVVDEVGEVFGDVPNIAARAQALAEPGTIVITARVQRQVAGLFVAEERGSHDLKGVSQPVMLFRIVRASGAGRRPSRRHLTPMVGRDEEIAILMRRWDRARQGDGQFVLIVGEPGLGKTRLLEEFHNRLGDTPHTWVEWSFLQLLQNTPLHPIVVAILFYRSLAHWAVGYPERALADAAQAVQEAREIGQAATLIPALTLTSLSYCHCGDYESAEWGRQRFGGTDVPAERRLAELENSLLQVKLEPRENIPLVAHIGVQEDRYCHPALSNAHQRRCPVWRQRNA